jgi:hypothetical protein
MASIIRIKRSSTSGNPSTLGAGELAYSAFSGSGGNRLYIGMGSETAGNAANHYVIGGTYYTGLIDASTAGTLTTGASSIPVLSSTGTIDQWYAGNLRLNGNTLSSTNTNGNIALTPNGSGAVQISGAYTLPTTAGTNGYALITNGTSAASWQAISTTLTINGGGASTGTVNLLNQSLTVAGGNGITTSMSGQTLTISSIGAGGYTSTATGGTTTTLTSSSSANQFFTGSTTQTVKLPSTATLTVGQEYIITNNSTGNLTVQTSAAGAITTQLAGTQITYTVASTGAETWVYEVTGFNAVTGTGAVVLATSPTLVTPTLGVATATSINKVAFTAPATGSTLTIADGKTLTASNTLTFTGTDSSSVAFGSGGTVLYNGGALGTPSSATLTNATGLPISTGVSGLATGIATFLATPTSANLASAITDETGSSTLVFSNSPTLVTPTLGVASATSINKVAITAPATGSTLTIADGKTLTASNTLTFTGTDSSSVAFGTGGTVVYTSNNLSVFSATTSSQLAGIISDETGSGALVFGTSPTIGTPTITGGTLSAITTLGIRDTSAAFDVTVGATSSVTLTAGRALTIDVQNAARTIALGGNISLAGTLTTAGAFTTSGAFGVTLTATATTALTLPTTGTLATLAGSETLTNKTLSTGSTWNGNTVGVAYGGTGTTTGSITGTGALTFTSGGTNTNVNLVPNGTGTVDVAGFRITSLGTPTQTTDAVTKGYVDSVKQALDIKDSVRVATTGNLTATASGAGLGKTLTNSGTQAAITIDSIVLISGDRVLVKDQTTGADNGIYTVTTVGTASTNWVLTRATDADNSAPTNEVTAGLFTFVEEGTVNQDSGWVLATNNPITLDTTSLSFVQFSGAGQVIAGNGLTKTGNQIDVVGAANRISVFTDNIDISASYVGQTSLTTLGTITTGTWNGSVIGATYGGTGINNGSNTITLGGNISTAGALTLSGAYSTTLTLTANTSVTLPTTGTLATLAGTEALSNKTITASSFSGTTVAASGLITFTNTTDAGPLGTAGVVMSGGLSVAKQIYVGTNITGAGAATSTLDGFQIDGGTY